jgi:hypothetical protein
MDHSEELDMPVPPKPPSKRRRRNVPKTYGAATPTIGQAAGPDPRTLDIDNPHPMVERMWTALQTSAEARFYSEADWERARFELLYANKLLTSDEPITGAAWATVQHGLSAMLISPAEKRRAGIELKPPVVDPDEIAAVSMMSGYRDKLRSSRRHNGQG